MWGSTTGAVRTTLALATGLVFASPQAPAQPPTGIIIGRVTDGATNTPVTSAIVTLTGAGTKPQRVVLDGRGRFLFAQLPAGAYTINAVRTGYLDGTYGRVRPDGAGRTLELAAGERVVDAVVQLWKFGAIAGAVTDDTGDPMQYARVQALRRTVIAGRWRLSTTGSGANSDERGQYRIAGLPPGDYALVITAMNSTLPASLLSIADELKRGGNPEAARGLQAKGTFGYVNDLMQGFPVVRAGGFLLQTSADRVMPVTSDTQPIEAYPTVWHPSGASPGAGSIVTVNPGDERTGIDLRPVLTRTYRVSGMVTGPDGPVPHVALRLVPESADSTAAEITSSLSQSMTTAMTATDASGAFTFLVVPPGSYVIRALISPPPIREAETSTVVRTPDGMASAVAAGPPPPPMVSTDPVLWATAPVTVGAGDTSGVAVTMRPGVRVTGMVVFSGAAAKPDARLLRAIRASMDPADGRTVAFPTAYQAQIDAEGRFYTIGLMAGRYVLRIDNAPPGWTLKSAMVAGRDISDVPLSLESADVDGLVLEFSDRPASLAGAVRDAQSRLDPNATVLIFPADGNWIDRGPSPRRMQSARVSRSGDYAFHGLPPGDYFAVAVSDAVVANWQDPVFLKTLSRLATRVTVREGQATSTSLTVAGAVTR
jgi:hypothetical protein